MRVDHRLILVPLLAAIGGCGPALEPLRVRASYDMVCSEQGLTLTKLETDAYTVAGCGRRVNYVYVQEQWIADPTTFGAPFGGPIAQPTLPMQPAWIGLPTWPPSPAPPVMPPLQAPPQPPAAPPPAPSAPLR